jgi:hypothetical protein
MVGGAGSTTARGLRWPAGWSSWPGMTSTDPRQPSLGWLDVRPHASNRVLVTVVTQWVVGLEKSRAVTGRERRRRAGRLAAVGRMWALWICLARSRIWTAHVTVFNKTTGVPLTAVQQLEFHRHYSKYRWEILSSLRMVRLLTLTSGLVSWAMMVSEPGSPLLGVGSAVIFFILAADADAWACHNFFLNETCFPDLLGPIKQHLKIIKIWKIRIWTFRIWIKYQQSHLCDQDS